jgi:CheY-like chemotaxis protein
MSDPSTARLLAGLKILVVEDETMVFFLTADILRDLGCTEVVHAYRPADALSIVGREPDLALLDVNLAGERP